MRRFEKISMKQFDIDFKNYDSVYEDIKLPERKTKFSSGYDFYLPFDVYLKPFDSIIIPTGIRVLMNNDEFLAIYIRSSLGYKYNVRMCNQVGIIDADYYNNIDNEGHIFIKIKNEGDNIVKLKKNDRYVQGIFQKYYLVDSDTTNGTRRGGIGSTNRGDENYE